MTRENFKIKRNGIFVYERIQFYLQSVNSNVMRSCYYSCTYISH